MAKLAAAPSCPFGSWPTGATSRPVSWGARSAHPHLGCVVLDWRHGVGRRSRAVARPICDGVVLGGVSNTRPIVLASCGLLNTRHDTRSRRGSLRQSGGEEHGPKTTGHRRARVGCSQGARQLRSSPALARGAGGSGARSGARKKITPDAIRAGDTGCSQDGFCRTGGWGDMCPACLMTHKWRAYSQAQCAPCRRPQSCAPAGAETRQCRAPERAPVKGGRMAAGSAGLRPSDRRYRRARVERVGSGGNAAGVSPEGTALKPSDSPIGYRRARFTCPS